jgi:hypothetical protein
MAGNYLPAAERDRAQVWLDGPTRDVADEVAALLTLERGGKRITRVGAVRIALMQLHVQLKTRQTGKGENDG